MFGPHLSCPRTLTSGHSIGGEQAASPRVAPLFVVLSISAAADSTP